MPMFNVCKLSSPDDVLQNALLVHSSVPEGLYSLWPLHDPPQDDEIEDAEGGDEPLLLYAAHSPLISRPSDVQLGMLHRNFLGIGGSGTTDRKHCIQANFIAPEAPIPSVSSVVFDVEIMTAASSSSSSPIIIRTAALDAAVRRNLDGAIIQEGVPLTVRVVDSLTASDGGVLITLLPSKLEITELAAHVAVPELTSCACAFFGRAAMSALRIGFRKKSSTTVPFTLLSEDSGISTVGMSTATNVAHSEGTSAAAEKQGEENKKAKAAGGRGNEKKAPQIVNFRALGIGGADAELETMFTRVFAPRALCPEVRAALGTTPVKGLLLHGPPGCGKTLIARKLCTALRSRPPKVVNGPEVLSRFFGASEENVRVLFKDAEEEQEARGDASELHVIILDEMDSICRARGNPTSSSSGGSASESVVNQLLAKMDGVRPLHNVLLIGLTNRLDLIDPALLRPGRFEVVLEVGLPSEAARQEILDIHFEAMRASGVLSPSVDTRELAERTTNFTGAELEGIVRAASAHAASRMVDRETLTQLPGARLHVSMADVEHGLASIIPAFGKRSNSAATVTASMSRFYGGMWCPTPSCLAVLSALSSFVSSSSASASATLSTRGGRILLYGDHGVGKSACLEAQRLNTHCVRNHHGLLAASSMQLKERASKMQLEERTSLMQLADAGAGAERASLMQEESAAAGGYGQQQNIWSLYQVRRIGPDTLKNELSEGKRAEALLAEYVAAVRCKKAVLQLDDIEKLIGYIPIGQRVSPILLQTISGILDSVPPPGTSILILCTSSLPPETLAALFGLHFASTIQLPPLSREDVRTALATMTTEAAAAATTSRRSNEVDAFATESAPKATQRVHIEYATQRVHIEDATQRVCIEDATQAADGICASLTAAAFATQAAATGTQLVERASSMQEEPAATAGIEAVVERATTPASALGTTIKLLSFNTFVGNPLPLAEVGRGLLRSASSSFTPLSVAALCVAIFSLPFYILVTAVTVLLLRSSLHVVRGADSVACTLHLSGRLQHQLNRVESVGADVICLQEVYAEQTLRAYRDHFEKDYVLLFTPSNHPNMRRVVKHAVVCALSSIPALGLLFPFHISTATLLISAAFLATMLEFWPSLAFIDSATEGGLLTLVRRSHFQVAGYQSYKFTEQGGDFTNRIVPRSFQVMRLRYRHTRGAEVCDVVVVHIHPNALGEKGERGRQLSQAFEAAVAVKGGGSELSAFDALTSKTAVPAVAFGALSAANGTFALPSGTSQMRTPRVAFGALSALDALASKTAVPAVANGTFALPSGAFGALSAANGTFAPPATALTIVCGDTNEPEPLQYVKASDSSFVDCLGYMNQQCKYCGSNGTSFVGGKCGACGNTGGSTVHLPAVCTWTSRSPLTRGFFDEPDHRSDFIFINSDTKWKIAQAKVVLDGAPWLSDHLGVFAEFF